MPPIRCDFYETLFDETEAQIYEIRHIFEYYIENPVWLEWPPKLFAFTEAAWNAGEHLNAGQVITDIVNRVYRRTDSRMVGFENEDKNI